MKNVNLGQLIMGAILSVALAKTIDHLFSRYSSKK